MTNPLQNPLWYRVADLRPVLSGHAIVRPQTFRDELWYVIENRISGRFFRFSPAAHQLIAMMDGRLTTQEIWDAACETLDEEAPTQDEVVDLLSRLYGADLLQTDVIPDLTELVQRRSRKKKTTRTQQIKNPLAIRIPLWDPDATLQRLAPRFRRLFGWRGLAIWALFVAVSLILAAAHWNEITENVTDQLLAPQNLLLIWVMYPLIKGLHEMGHGLATKIWGGEVHQMGVMLLALMPVPYADASAASGFPEKKRRIAVSAAGIMVEIFLACLALFVWLAVEPGVVKSVAYNVLLIGSVSTLFVNGNPLLRFDGYYVFSDAIGIPNLATRSTRYLGYLVQRYLIGLPDVNSPANTPDERAWFLFYGIASYVYRVVIMVTIILFVAEEYPLFGTFIAILAAATLFLLPVGKQMGFLLRNPRLQRRRGRALLVSGLLSAAVIGFLFGAPFPLTTVAQGVVSAPEQSEVRAGGNGIVTRLLAGSGSPVVAGQPLIETEDPYLASELALLEAKLRELRSRQQALAVSREQVKADILAEEISVVEANLALARERTASLVIHSPGDGIFLTEQPKDLPGRFLKQGELIGQIINTSQPSVRVALPQADIGLVRKQTKAVEVRFAEQLTKSVPAEISREVPAAADNLPSPALGPIGGGPFAVDPEDTAGVRSLERIFELKLRLSHQVDRLGGRVYVRFLHGHEPLALQWYRRVRQLFLRRFSV